MTTKPVPAPIVLSGDQTSHIWQASRAVSRAEYGVENANDFAKDALYAAGIGDATYQPIIRTEYIIGYMIARMYPELETISSAERDAVSAVRALYNPESKSAAKRTVEEETLVKSATKSWSRMLGYCDVKTVSPQGGARPNTGGAAAEPAAEPTAIEATPAAKDGPDAVKYVALQAATMLAYTNKARAGGVTGAPFMRLCQAVATFHTAVLKIVAELDKEAGK